MDTTGGDLRAAAEILDEKIERKISHNSDSGGIPQDAIVTDEKRASSSSSSSSSDGPEIFKKLDSRVINIPEEKDIDAALSHLPEHEKEVLKRQLDVPTVTVTYRTLYRYATTWDLIFVVIGALCAIVGGAVMPLMTIIFGQLTGVFQGFFLGTVTREHFNHELVRFTVYFVYLAVGEFVTIYSCTVAFMYTGEHVSGKIREQYLAAILRQNIGFFDLLGAGEITTRITADTNLIQDGLSEKIALTMTGVATFVTAFVIAFIKSWKLTLILSSGVFLIVFIMGGGSTFMIKFNKKSLESYALGGSVAEEVISSIRNAVAFATQDKLARQYDEHLREAEKWGMKLRIILSMMIGAMLGTVNLINALSFWQGSRYLVTGDITLADILTIMLCIMIGAFSLGNVAPNTQAFGTAISAAAKIFNTIDRTSPLDPTDDKGETLGHVEGTLELRNIKHIYPSRPSVVVMDNVSLKVPAGKTTALVGASGSGKSTIVGLVERFYDPVGGKVFLDGHDISTLNLRWLRHHISIVSQEPTLFGTTIYHNIAHGLIGTAFETANKEVQIELIETAAKKANAHDFVSGLPDGYQTHVGERGFLLSGGQKQRIAIARAIVSDPKILLLDEATSALDTKSEGIVQEALDTAAKGRTTIVIAHRLSTIKTADNIVVMSQGRIVEQGPHNDLIEKRGAYYNLVEAQRISAELQDNADGVSEDQDSASDEMIKLPSATKITSKQELQRMQTSKSVSSMVLKTKEKSGAAHYPLWTLIKVVAGFNRSDKFLMYAGLVWSIIAGGGNPAQSVFFAKSITALTLPPSRYGQLRHDADFWAAMYFMLAIVVFIAMVASGWTFGYCAERLIHRARDQAFRTMLRQEIAWFDREENSAGALTSFLSTQTTFLAGISGVTLGTILMVSTTLVASIIVGTAIGWKLALVCISIIPLLLACGYLRFFMLAQFARRSKKAYEGSASYACEATGAIRTVASLTREQDVWQQYHQRLAEQGKRSLPAILKSSSLYAASQAVVFLCNALGFWYGGTLIANGEYSQFQFFLVFATIIFGAQSAGTIFSFAPDMGKAKNAARELKTLFDNVPSIDTWSKEGQNVENVQGHIEFRDVHFRYPTRPEQPVLKGLNLTVKPGQYVALVGASGCGKSTTIQLMERFYDPLSGGVYVDGREITSLNVNQYRSFLSLVSQEPTLYQGSIRENVLLGADRDDVPEEEIMQACKDANIYDFIMSLP